MDTLTLETILRTLNIALSCSSCPLPDIEVTHAAAHMQACTCQCDPGSVLSPFSTVAVTETPFCVLRVSHSQGDYVYNLLFACGPLTYETALRAQQPNEHFSNNESACRTMQAQNIFYGQAVIKVNSSLLGNCQHAEIPPLR